MFPLNILIEILPVYIVHAFSQFMSIPRYGTLSLSKSPKYMLHFDQNNGELCHMDLNTG